MTSFVVAASFLALSVMLPAKLRYRHEVFLSFAGEDRERVATPIYDLLTEQGVKVFLDKESISAGENIDVIVPRAIRKSIVFVALITENFLLKARNYPGEEVRMADDARGVTLQALFFEQTEKRVAAYSSLDALREHAKIPDNFIKRLDDVQGACRRICEMLREAKAKRICEFAANQPHAPVKAANARRFLVHCLYVTSPQGSAIASTVKEYVKWLGATKHVEFACSVSDPSQDELQRADKGLLRNADFVFVILTSHVVGNRNFQSAVSYAMDNATRVVPIFTSSLTSEEAQKIPVFSNSKGIGMLRGIAVTVRSDSILADLKTLVLFKNSL